MEDSEDKLLLDDVELTNQIDDIKNITEYEEEDNDFLSSLFQGLQIFGGGLVTCISLPFGCCCGPTVTIPEGNRGALLRFGKLKKIRPPGTYFMNVGSEKYQIVNIQIQTMTIPKQSVITKDGISISVDAVCFYQVDDIKKAIFSVENYTNAVRNLSQYTLEVVLGEYDLDKILQERDTISNRIKTIIQHTTHKWGVDVSGIEIRDIKMSQDLVRVMASMAEATREGQSKIISAEAELKAADAYSEAAETLSKTPGAMQLRYLKRS